MPSITLPLEACSVVSSCFGGYPYEMTSSLNNKNSEKSAMLQPLFFAHANGFPSSTYRKLLSRLEDDFSIRYLDCHGHDPLFPVTDNWSRLLEELLQHVQRVGEPVIGVGHSLGGLLHYYAASRRPDLYRGVILLDSPLLTWLDRSVIFLSKKLGFIDRITPAAKTVGRREFFLSHGEAHEYFAHKKLFSHFDPECLNDYVEYGMQPHPYGFCLRFNPETEIDIYRSVPHSYPLRTDQFEVPLALLAGTESTTVKQRHIRAASSVPGGQVHLVPGSHMFPFERPEQTTALIRDIIGNWQEKSS